MKRDGFVLILVCLLLVILVMFAGELLLSLNNDISSGKVGLRAAVTNHHFMIA